MREEYFGQIWAEILWTKEKGENKVNFKNLAHAVFAAKYLLGVIRAMRKSIHFIAGITALAGVNIGFIKILIFLYHQWGGIGVAVGFTFVPPIFICPIWEWVATGHYMTFVLVYVLGFGGFGLCKYIGD